MVVYLDLVFLINFFFDAILLFSVALILRRQTSLKKILLGSLGGTISICCLFLNISSFILLLLKFLMALLMVIITFSYRDFRYTIRNILYLYMVSMVLGGFLYLIQVEFNYQNDGIIFYDKGLSYNFYLMLFTSPLILYMFIRQIKQLKNNYSNYYHLDIYLNDGRVISVTSFLDTGNNLFDPYKNRPIILIEKNKIKSTSEKIILVPYNTIDSHGLLECFSPEKIYINKIGWRKNLLIGLIDEVGIEGADCILNQQLLERI